MSVDRPPSVHSQIPPALTEIAALAVVVGGGIVALFAVFILLLLPFALLNGTVGDHARVLVRELLRLFHALLRCIAAYASRR